MIDAPHQAPSWPLRRYAVFVVTIAVGVGVMAIGANLRQDPVQIAGFLLALSGFLPLWMRGIYVWLHGVSGRNAARFGTSLAMLGVLGIAGGVLFAERGVRGVSSVLTKGGLASFIALGVTCAILFGQYFLRFLFGAMNFFRR